MRPAGRSDQARGPSLRRTAGLLLQGFPRAKLDLPAGRTAARCRGLDQPQRRNVLPCVPLAELIKPAAQVIGGRLACSCKASRGQSLICRRDARQHVVGVSQRGAPSCRSATQIFQGARSGFGCSKRFASSSPNTFSVAGSHLSGRPTSMAASARCESEALRWPPSAS